MKHKVPYYSQFTDVTDPKRQSHVCSICCVKMALDFLSPGRTPDLDRLIEEAFIHAKSMTEHGLITEQASTHGFVHDVLVTLAHNYGVVAYKEEFKSMSLDADNKPITSQYAKALYAEGIAKIVAALKSGALVIVSVLPGLATGESFHTILLTGFEDHDGHFTGFYYHDPDARDVPRKDQFITSEYFDQFWRKMAIFIG